MHPEWPLLVTAGVERFMLLHSPLPSGPCFSDSPLTPQEVRALPPANTGDRRRFIRALALGGAIEEDDNDNETIALFDEFVLDHLYLYVFTKSSGTQNSTARGTCRFICASVLESRVRL